MKKANIFFWALYGFAKDVMIVAFSLYFSQWLVVENKVSDLWYNLIFVASSILLLCGAPLLAVIADKKQRSLPYLRFMAVALFAVTLGCGIFAVFSPQHRIFVLFSALCFLLSEYFYQFSLIFHNSLLEKIALPEKRGLVSGIGYAANWLGQIAGIFISLPIAAGAIYFFGEKGRAQTFIPATVLFFVFALPMLLFFKEQKPPQQIIVDYKAELKNLAQKLKDLFGAPGVGRFLLAFFFYNDAILTMENNYAIYLQRVFGVSDKTKSVLLLGVLAATLFGAFFSGIIADKIGLKKALLWIMAALVIIFPFLGLAPTYKAFAILAIGMGIFYGSSLTVARAVLAYLVPQQQVNHTFSYYSLVERFATFVGPVSWGLVLVLLNRYGIWNYKVAVIVMGLFILIGTVIVRKIPSDKAVKISDIP